MRKIFKFFMVLFTGVALLTSCQDDEPVLGEKLDKSEISFDVVQDYNVDGGGNTVILRNNTPGTISLWDYGTGRSTRAVDTVRFAFQGEYVIKFSVTTAGGVVEMDPVTVVVTEDNLNYVNHPLWTLLTGGVGNEKTWILDNGQYGLATGPLAYADPGRAQVWGDFQPNWEPAAGDVGIGPEFQEAEMTFKLSGGPFITTVKPNEPGGDESGTFFLDVDSHTLSTTDATVIRPANFIANVSNWTQNLNILELTENQMRIAVMRTNDEGPWWYILNYVSKEFADNYVPEFVPDPNFNHGDQMFFLAGNSATTWKLSTETPFNWTDLSGTLLNADWTSIEAYPDWTGYNDAAIANIENVRITFSKNGDVTITNNDGSIERGDFTVDAPKNIITFQRVKPEIYISGGWVTATTTSYFEDEAGNVITGDNQWKIVKTRSIAGIVTDVWFGKRDTGKKEYMVYHFELESGLPDIKKEMIKGLAGGSSGTTSRTFKIDVNWPVDWTNLEGTGWTVAGTQEGWYWSDEIAASVKNQTLTFTQTDGVVTVTKKDEAGNTSTSPVTIDGENQMVIIDDIDIIQFGAGSWLPTAGPEYKWVRGDYTQVSENGFWLGVRSGDNEYTAYHYILK